MKLILDWKRFDKGEYSAMYGRTQYLLVVSNYKIPRTGGSFRLPVKASLYHREPPNPITLALGRQLGAFPSGFKSYGSKLLATYTGTREAVKLEVSQNWRSLIKEAKFWAEEKIIPPAELLILQLNGT